MSPRAMGSEKCGGPEKNAENVHIRQRSGGNHAKSKRPALSREKSPREGEGGECMRCDVHGYRFGEEFPFALTLVRGTSSFNARGTIENSTGKRARGSPSTCA